MHVLIVLREFLLIVFSILDVSAVLLFRMTRLKTTLFCSGMYVMLHDRPCGSQRVIPRRTSCSHTRFEDKLLGIIVKRSFIAVLLLTCNES